MESKSPTLLVIHSELMITNLIFDYVELNTKHWNVFNLTCLGNTKSMLKKLKIVNEFQHSKVSNMMIIISRNVFQPNFPFILINAVNLSISAFQPRESNLTHEQVSNWYVISNCTFTKHLLLGPFQQTNCCFVLLMTRVIDWFSTVTILYVCWSTTLQ